MMALYTMDILTTFIEIHSHTGLKLEKCIMEILQEYIININNCRGQSYDNASNMSGIYNWL